MKISKFKNMKYLIETVRVKFLMELEKVFKNSIFIYTLATTVPFEYKIMMNFKLASIFTDGLGIKCSRLRRGYSKLTEAKITPIIDFLYRGFTGQACGQQVGARQ